MGIRSMRNLSLLLLLLASWTVLQANPLIRSTFNGETTVESLGSDPGASADVIEQRLRALESEIDLKYTKEVRGVIDNFLKTGHGRKRVASLLMMGSYYFPIFERALEEAGLPAELKFLPVIESGLNPKATSPVGAGGLWQFMPATAKGYDLKIDSKIDERNDPYLSSRKACEFLKKQYGRFGDWTLALAAYNAGPGTVQSAIQRAGGGSKHTFWTIKKYLPAETQHYVPKFIAMTYVLSYYAAHNIPEINIASPLTSDTVQISENTSISKISAKVNVSVDDLKRLNPHFRTDVIAGSVSRPCTLVLPSENAYSYKKSLGRHVDERHYAQRQQSVKAKNSEIKVDDKSAKRKDTWDDYAYESVPSKTMPGVYVRVPRGNNKNK